MRVDLEKLVIELKDDAAKLRLKVCGSRRAHWPPASENSRREFMRLKNMASHVNVICTYLREKRGR